MRRAFFFVLMAACGGASESARVEIAQPLPTVTATATASVAEPVPAPHEYVPDVGDPRRPPRRSVGLLQTEVRSLEALLASTTAGSPDMPVLLLHAAETYVELRKMGDASASQKAIAHYTTLTSQFPSFANVDAAWFGLAIEYEANDDANHARRTFYELIKNQPLSRFVPYAYFAFGDLFQKEASADPSKWDFAKQAYEEVKRYPSSPIAAEATCRLSEIATAQGEGPRATALRQEVVRNFPNSAAARRCGGP